MDGIDIEGVVCHRTDPTHLIPAKPRITALVNTLLQDAFNHQLCNKAVFRVVSCSAKLAAMDVMGLTPSQQLCM